MHLSLFKTVICHLVNVPCNGSQNVISEDKKIYQTCENKTFGLQLAKFLTFQAARKVTMAESATRNVLIVRKMSVTRKGNV